MSLVVPVKKSIEWIKKISNILYTLQDLFLKIKTLILWSTWKNVVYMQLWNKICVRRYWGFPGSVASSVVLEDWELIGCVLKSYECLFECTLKFKERGCACALFSALFLFWTVFGIRLLWCRKCSWIGAEVNRRCSTSKCSDINRLIFIFICAACKFVTVISTLRSQIEEFEVKTWSHLPVRSK